MYIIIVKHNLRELNLILTDDCRDHSAWSPDSTILWSWGIIPWWNGVSEETSYFLTIRKQREENQGQDRAQDHTSCDLLPPAVTCFLQPCPTCLLLPPYSPFRSLILKMDLSTAEGTALICNPVFSPLYITLRHCLTHELFRGHL